MASVGDAGARLGMLVVETIAKIRRAYFAQNKPIKTICRELRVSRRVVRKVIRSQATEFRYERSRQPRPRIDPWREQLDGLLLENEGKPVRERLTRIRIFEELRAVGYEGSYDAIRRYAKRWRTERGAVTAEAYVPLSFAPGEAYQFDWSHEIVLINGTTVTVKVAHVRLCHSRMLFVRAYPRETHEMVFDAHNRAFAFFKGTCTRGIYDNMKTAVETVFIGKDRQFNRRFLRMCGHYLVAPTACTPASGWEKGQVENQVRVVRERFFTPRLRVASYEELNAWLLDRCVAYAKAQKHPELADCTIWQATGGAEVGTCVVRLGAAHRGGKQAARPLQPSSRVRNGIPRRRRLSFLLGFAHDTHPARSPRARDRQMPLRSRAISACATCGGISQAQKASR